MLVALSLKPRQFKSYSLTEIIVLALVIEAALPIPTEHAWFVSIYTVKNRSSPPVNIKRGLRTGYKHGPSYKKRTKHY